MGYRSDVAYTIRFHYHGDGYWRNVETEGEKVRTREQAESLFKLFLAEAKSKDETRGCFDEGWLFDEYDNGEGFMVDMEKLRINFLATSVKWYPDYTDVKCHNALIDLADEYIKDEATYYVDSQQRKAEVIGLAYVCIGENNDDVFEKYSGDFDYEWVFCSRQLVTDFN